jgi:hypothetical protein
MPPEPQAERPTGTYELTRANRFKTWANLSIFLGVAAFFVGASLPRRPDVIWAALVSTICGWALWVWGSVNYVRWKGRSGWLGLLGYLLLPGLIGLVCLQNRRRRLREPGLREQGPGTLDELAALSRDDQKSGYRYLAILAPFPILLLGVAVLEYTTRRSIDPADWKRVAAAGVGFQALMPGIAEVQHNTQETPAGVVEVHKFSVRPHDKTNELFMIVSTRIPDTNESEPGRAARLLELARDDVLTACQGQLQSEKPINAQGCQGVEIEALPAKGGIVAARIYATQNQVFELCVHSAKNRLKSDDARKFFDSFQLSNRPPAHAAKGSE